MIEITGKYNTAKVFTDTLDEIVHNIAPTAGVANTVKPVYNFKAAD